MRDYPRTTPVPALILCLFAAIPLSLSAQPSAGSDEALLEGRGIPVTQDALRHAATSGQLEVVDQLLREGLDPNSADERGRTPLMHAAFAGHFDVARRLLEAGAPVNDADVYDATPLIYASSEGFPNVVALLLDSGADPELTDSFHGWTALMYASFEGHAEIVEQLIAAGADVNYSDPEKGFTALMYAAFQGYPDVIGRLLDAGADVEATNLFGETAQMLASPRGFEDIVTLVGLERDGR